MQISLKDVGYIYQEGTPIATRALHDIDLVLPDGKFTVIIGHTGSGKSTLLQHLNALLIPSSGEVQIGERIIRAKEKNKQLKSVRQQVGIVFQFPEYQLFEETVEKDICFGPMNYGVSEDEAKQRARRYIQQVGLDETILEQSPFELSGGQMRRVAIAGILAMEPSTLVLDEPTAGLDPRGSREMMEMFQRIHREQNLTVIVVTHNMEDAAKFADEIIIMEKGSIAQKGSPEEIFTDVTTVENLGLSLPKTLQFQLAFEAKSGCKLSKRHLHQHELVAEISELVKRVKIC